MTISREPTGNTRTLFGKRQIEVCVTEYDDEDDDLVVSAIRITRFWVVDDLQPPKKRKGKGRR